jgi:aminopeptidase
MRDPRLAKLAELLVNYSNEVKPGDWSLIMGELVTLPLLRELYRAVLEAGAYPEIVLSDPESGLLRVQLGNDEQLNWVSPLQEMALDKADVLFRVLGTDNTRRLSSADPSKLSTMRAAARPMFENYIKRASTGDLRWVIARFPTEANAQEAEMSLMEYEDFVFQACMVDEEDPVAAWRQVQADQDKIVAWLEGKKKLVAKGPHLDLQMSIADRPFINCRGDDNMPDGEVFTSPVEGSVEGWIRFSYPSLEGGRKVEGAELIIKEGQVVEAKADKGEDYLLSQLDTDEGARRIGEFAIGTNYGIQRATGDALFDEKIGGSVHMAIGHGVPEAGGTNTSSIHWDMVTDMRDGGQIWVDDELLYENGKFAIL